MYILIYSYGILWVLLNLNAKIYEKNQGLLRSASTPSTNCSTGAKPPGAVFPCESSYPTTENKDRIPSGKLTVCN